MKEIESICESDQELLLRFQRAFIERYKAILRGDKELELEHAYCQAQLALDGLTDPTLKDLAKDTTGPSIQRSYEAERELVALSRRIVDFYPGLSLEVH
jgi:hypothetical protein